MSGLYIAPVRNDTGYTTNSVYYNPTTKELTYTVPTSSGLSTNGGYVNGTFTMTSVAPQIVLNGGTANYISMPGGGLGTPTVGVSTVGTRILLYPGSAITTDYAIGISNAILWSGVPATDGEFRWYGGTSLYATLKNSGLSVTGSITATGDITGFYSDRRLKENVKPINNAVDRVLQLTGITYNPNALAESFGFDRNVDLVGVFAQDVQVVLPEAVKPAPFDDDQGTSRSGENYLTVQYEKIVPLLIQAIKEQQAQIEDLKKQIHGLSQG